SANAVQVARAVSPGQRIFMTPDRNLAQYTISRTGRDILYWDGFCPVHENLSADRVREVKQAHPGALFLAHPECRPEVLALADEVKSTSGMIDFVGRSEATEFIIGTETGILYPLSQANFGKRFIPADPRMVCRDMKRTGLEDILRSLETMGPVVRVPDAVAAKARRAVERMLAVPKG
ncbi:MAG: quinolinate synthase NadA, partial [Deltaproteobacteria bacterium]|nr:quinolinate synthase NadA [Deltaproteobacteria bacterium]